jgi:hypothetical protein
MTLRKRKNLWRHIVSEWRLWSFHVYYERCFHGEKDKTLRFAKALCASLRPVRDRAGVMEWWKNRDRWLRRNYNTDGDNALPGLDAEPVAATADADPD